jgi:hypothetical protein
LLINIAIIKEKKANDCWKKIKINIKEKLQKIFSMGV